MASSISLGWAARFLRISRKLTIMAGTTAVPGRFLIEPKANPSTCTEGELNVTTAGELYVCSDTDTWSLVGDQTAS